MSLDQSTRRSSIVWPGIGRITLVLSAVTPAAMAYPWQSTRERWVLGIAAVAVIVLLSWSRGLHLTTVLGRRLAMMRRDERPVRQSGTDARTTALLRITPPASGPGLLPLPLLAGYLNRYGIRADVIRVTSRDTVDGRDTWIGLTLSATDNLAALRARSPRIPLYETAEVAVRRLADHLRETGWVANAAGSGDVPQLFAPGARETWHGIWDGGLDYVAAYRVNADGSLPDTLAGIWSQPVRETWTAVEIAGAADRWTLAAACAFRTDVPPPGAPPVAGLTPQRGNHRRALRALDPLSAQRLDGHTDMPDDLLAVLRWPTGAATAPAPPPRPRHAAAGRT